ncbi:MAG: flavocytochrome c [Oscillospiraceae bacterium]
MNSKKILAGIASLAMTFALLAGCGTNASSISSSADSSAPQAQTMQADIVVIGAGGAGMTAAIQAAQDGATNVVVVEKMPITGGNTTRSTGGLNAAATKYQEEAEIEDSVELFVQDTMKSGKELNDIELVTVMAENSAAAVDWVNDIGGDLSVVGMFGGASVERIHRPSDTSAVGPMLVKALNNKMAELNIPVLLNTTATSILVDETGAVSGITATNANGQEITINCKAVVLATGGFGANSEMVVQYNPDLQGFSTTNHSGATGDGIVMAEQLDVALVDMEQIQTHPTVNPDTSDMYTEGVRGNGAILVNTEGKRFVNELETRDVVSAAILEQPEAYSWLLFDEPVRESLKAIETYISAGIVFEADTVEGLAEQIGVDAATLQEMLDTYGGYVASGTDADFARPDSSMLSELKTPKFYAAKCAPAVHHTMGGVKINTNTEVLNTEGTAIPGLFAAGEVTGGVHGANRLGGNAVTDIVVFGRIAGSASEAYIVANGGNTEPTIEVPNDTEEVKPEVQGTYKDGTYTGTGKGNNGDITVEVVVEDGNITSITLTEHAETEGIYEGAEKGVIANIIRTQSTEVDTVAGATNSSNGIMEAVAAALADAQ